MPPISLYRHNLSASFRRQSIHRDFPTRVLGSSVTRISHTMHPRRRTALLSSLAFRQTAVCHSEPVPSSGHDIAQGPVACLMSSPPPATRPLKHSPSLEPPGLHVLGVTRRRGDMFDSNGAARNLPSIFHIHVDVPGCRWKHSNAPHRGLVTLPTPSSGEPPATGLPFTHTAAPIDFSHYLPHLAVNLARQSQGAWTAAPPALLRCKAVISAASLTHLLRRNQRTPPPATGTAATSRCQHFPVPLHIDRGIRIPQDCTRRVIHITIQ